MAIRVDLNRALMDPRQRILIQPEDTIIVQYTLVEELFNTALGLFQVNYLINGLGGGAGF
jgi:ATP-dependent protease HslVU (ClpYQ) ATPase subunit